MKRNRNNSLFDRTLLRQSLRASFQKLDPRKMVKMFCKFFSIISRYCVY